MRFEEDDEDAFAARRDELSQLFAQWLQTQRVPGDPNDAGLLMDWKFGYGDGFLDVWTIVDVEEFLLTWCPRKLSAAPDDSAEIPLSVAAFVEFLAHTGLLAPPSAPPAQVRRFCEQNTKKFVREMSNPANFGLAKSIFGGLGGLPSPDDPEFTGFLEHMVLDEEDEEPVAVGPVRLPDERERRDAIRAAVVPRQLRQLAEFCAPPGRPLTGKGNLRLADARHLVTALGTGDDPEFGGYRRLTSAEDLPVLSWLFDLALEAGVVRRKLGRLVAVARFAALDEVAAHEKMVRAAVGAGLCPAPYWSSPALEVARSAANESVAGLLADLLDAGSEGLARDELFDTMAELLAELTFGMPDLVGRRIPGWVSTQVERLAALGVVAVDGDRVRLTAAGTPVAVDLVRDAGIEVVLRADPATADAAAIVDLVGMVPEHEWVRDAMAWVGARPERYAAMDRLVAEICAEHRDVLVLTAGLNALAEAAPEEVIASVRRQLDGPHHGLALAWLAARGAIAPGSIDPMRLAAGLVELTAAILDLGEPENAVASFAAGATRDSSWSWWSTSGGSNTRGWPTSCRLLAPATPTRPSRRPPARR